MPKRALSAHQARIVEWALHGEGHAIVDAVAGSGKTSTLVAVWDALLRARKAKHAEAIFLSFNTRVRKELEQRLPGVTVRTINAFGLGVLSRHIGRDAGLALERRKYPRIIESSIRLAPPLGSNFHVAAARSEAERIVDLARLNLVDVADTAAVSAFLARYDFYQWKDLKEWYAKVARDALAQGCADFGSTGSYDFIDQLWLPQQLRCKRKEYRWLFVDEAQDLSAAQRELVLSSCSREGRMLFVGDPHQAIYGFAGADSESMRHLQETTRATRLPLSVSFRAPRCLARMATTFRADFEHTDDARDGKIMLVPPAEATMHLAPGDMVLCRTRAPLIDAYIALRSRGMPVGFGSRAIRDSMSHMLEMLASAREPFGKLLAHRDCLRKGRGCADARLTSEHADHVHALCKLALWCQAFTYQALRIVVHQLAEASGDDIRLMTIHQAKGLESDRVLLLRPDLLPHPNAESAWEVKQEQNLAYVAITRALDTLIVEEVADNSGHVMPLVIDQLDGVVVTLSAEHSSGAAASYEVWPPRSEGRGEEAAGVVWWQASGKRPEVVLKVARNSRGAGALRLSREQLASVCRALEYFQRFLGEGRIVYDGVPLEYAGIRVAGVMRSGQRCATIVVDQLYKRDPRRGALTIEVRALGEILELLRSMHDRLTA